MCKFYPTESHREEVTKSGLPNFEVITLLALLGIDKLTETSLTLLDIKNENVREIELEPMKIKVFHVLG